MKWAIIDLDGTVSDCTWRMIYATDARMEPDPDKRAKLWRGFHSRCGEDDAIEPVAEIVRAWAKAGNGVLYVTGRGAEWGKETLAWLRQHNLPAKPEHLFMRGDGDWRSAVEYKKDIYGRLIETPLWKRTPNYVVFVLEDDERLVTMWRGLGLLCLQVTR